MSTTFVQFRTDLRALLLDSVAPYVWPTTALDQVILQALGEYSDNFPKVTQYTTMLALNQREIVFTPAMESAYPSPNSNGEILEIWRVELPTNTPIPNDPQQTAPREESTTQGWYVFGKTLRLTNGASVAESTPNSILVYATRSWDVPNDVAFPSNTDWNGPDRDRPLVLRLAQRGAYGRLAEWLTRDQASVPNTVRTLSDIAGVIAALDAELTSSLNARRRRNISSRTVDR